MKLILQSIILWLYYTQYIGRINNIAETCIMILSIIISIGKWKNKNSIIPHLREIKRSWPISNCSWYYIFYKLQVIFNFHVIKKIKSRQVDVNSKYLNVIYFCGNNL